MIGLAYLVVFVLYLLISWGIVILSVRYARKAGRSTKRWGWGAAFVMYSVMFWDWVPTVAVHQFYCAKESGFWVYKTLDQWKAENPGVMETLVANKGEPFRHESFDDGHGKTNTYLVNERINWIVTQQDIFSFLPIIRTERQMRDVMKNEVLARYVDFGSGHSVREPGTPLKFWLHNQHCWGGQDRAINSAKLFNQFRGAQQ